MTELSTFGELKHVIVSSLICTVHTLCQLVTVIGLFFSGDFQPSLVQQQWVQCHVMRRSSRVIYESANQMMLVITPNCCRCFILCFLQTVEVAAVSVEGACHLFKLSLTDQKTTEPVMAFSSVQFVTEATKVRNFGYVIIQPCYMYMLQESTPTPLPVLTTHLSTTLTLAHTSHIRPHFETLVSCKKFFFMGLVSAYVLQNFDQSERSVCLIREVSSSGLLLGQQSTKRSKVTDSKVTVLGPENMAVKTTRAQKSTNPIEDNIPLSDRLEPVSKQARHNLLCI